MVHILRNTLLVTAVSALVFSSGSLAADCAEEATADFERGVAALDDGRYADAVASLEGATGACDAATYWQALGDANRAQLEGSDGDAASTYSQSALEAYGRAFARARTDQDDAAGARAARSIVELGLETGDPLKSQNWLMVATRLEPDHPSVPELEARLDEARGQLSTDEINTGLSQTRGIGMVNSLLGGDVSSNAFWDPEDESAGGAGGASVSGSIVTPEAPTTSTSSIDIPIRFYSNSTELTAETALNVQNLATVLTERPPSARITLTGHADVRGDAGYNQELSLARAEKIRDLLVAQEPSLDGRINALGDGESRPIDTGDSARSHANNRRLEVTIMEPVPTSD